MNIIKTAVQHIEGSGSVRLWCQNTDNVVVWFQILERDRKVVNDDRVKFEVLTSDEPLPVSYWGPDSFGFQTIKKSIRQIWGSMDVIVSAGLLCFTLMSLFRFC